MTEGWYIGLMTGTVIDGEIDTALLRTDGTRLIDLGAARVMRYAHEVTELLRRTLTEAAAWGFDGPEPQIFATATEALTRAQSDAVLQLIDHAGIRPSDVTAIGFHGQSVLHRAPAPGVMGRTHQLGDGALMARLTGIDTVFDFRSADVAAGGQGAPLAPVYHSALLDRLKAGPETALVNLGGVGNLSWRGDDSVIVAFDTGPANAPINDFIAARGRGALDQGGRLAASGAVDEAALAEALRHSYLNQPYPKSLDRNDFTTDWVAHLSDADGAATLTAFSAACVARGLDILPMRPQRLVLCGGGRRNLTLAAQIALRSGCTVIDADDLDLRGDVIEAECFAYLAARRLADLPISWPSTTGVPAPMTGGRIARA